MTLAEKPYCSHAEQELVRNTLTLVDFDEEGKVIFIHDQEYPFITWQCARCGAMTQKEVSLADLAQADDLPWLDADAYSNRTREREQEDTQWAALSFMNNAANTFYQPRNGRGKR